jgi:hypothetical protein
MFVHYGAMEIVLEESMEQQEVDPLAYPPLIFNKQINFWRTHRRSARHYIKQARTTDVRVQYRSKGTTHTIDGTL